VFGIFNLFDFSIMIKTTLLYIQYLNQVTFISLCLILISCNSDPDFNEQQREAQVVIKSHPKTQYHADSGNWKLEVTGSKVFYFDDRSTPEIFSMQYFEHNDSSFLAVANRNNNSVDFYDFSKGRLFKRVDIPVKDAPYTLSNMQGIFVHNADSVFVYAKGSLQRTLLTGLHGRLTSAEWYGAKPIDRFPLVNHLSTTTAPTVLHNKKIYAAQYPWVPPPEIQDRYAKSSIETYEVSYDLIADKTSFLPPYIPEEIQIGYWPGMYAMLGSRAIDKHGRFVYDWQMLPHLYVTDYQGTSFKVWAHREGDKLYAPPAGKQPKGKEETTNQDDLRIAITHSSNQGTLYNPYQDVFYRIISLPIKYNPKKHQNFTALDLKPIVLLTLDSDFNILATIELPAKTYRIFFGIPTPEGLYLSRFNAYNEEITEDQVQFDLITLEKAS
jgi:hypothetical protein